MILIRVAIIINLESRVLISLLTDLKIKFCSYDESSKTLLENVRLVRDGRRVAKSSDKF